MVLQSGDSSCLGDIHGGQPLPVHRDGLTGGVQLHSGRGLRGVLHHTDVSWRTEQPIRNQSCSCCSYQTNMTDGGSDLCKDPERCGPSDQSARCLFVLDHAQTLLLPPLLLLLSVEHLEEDRLSFILFLYIIQHG